MKKVAHRFINNLLWLYLSQIISLTFGFFTTVYIARNVTDTEFGQISFAQALLAFFLLITNFGFTTKATQLVARNHGKTSEIASQVVFLRAFLSSLVLLFIVIVLSTISLAQTKTYVILLFALTVIPSAFDLSWVFASHENMKLQGVVVVVRSTSIAALVFIFLGFISNVVVVGAVYFVSHLLASIIGLRMFFRKYSLFPNREFLRSLKQFLNQVIPLGLSLLMIRIYYSSDTIMLSYFHGDQVVAWYNSAYKIINVLITIGNLYGAVLLPTISHQVSLSHKAVQDLMFHSFRLLTVISLPLLIWGIAFGAQIVTFFFGQRYASGAIPFQILLGAAVVVLVSVVFTNGLIAFEMQKTLLKLVSLAAFVNVVTNLFVIPEFGMVGAATTTILAEVIVLMGGVWALRKKLDLTILKRTVLKIFALCAIMLLSFWIVAQLSMIAALFTNIGVFAMGLWRLGLVNRDDWTRLVHILNRYKTRIILS